MQKNPDYLKGPAKFTGFSEALENELREKVQKQFPEFSYTTTPNTATISPWPPCILKGRNRATCTF